MATEVMTFEDWMVAVNFWTNRIASLDTSDLPDCPYRDWYDNSVRPQTAARRALKSAKE